MLSPTSICLAESWRIRISSESRENSTVLFGVEVSDQPMPKTDLENEKT